MTTTQQARTQPAPDSAATPATGRRIEIYDTTLRDGTQGEGVALSLVDKIRIARQLDQLGVDYIEGGYPLSNPKDAAFFEEIRDVPLECARICAFGMTRRRGISPAEDPGMKALVDSKAPVVTIVGKTWDLHVDEVLRVSREENLAMIRESLAFVRESGAEVFYDAEHFFDGYRANPEYALQTLIAALQGGATRLVLCDTNGGSLPEWVSLAVTTLLRDLQPHLPAELRGKSDQLLGIHVHNDGGLAVANSLIAVQAGAVQVQGTINGIGERCGNVDLLAVIGNLALKMGMQCLRGPQSLARLTETSRYVYELANLALVPNQPFVGAAAFAHKGGMHVHAVQRVAHSYEHIAPQLVGNARRILVSELSGASNIAATLGAKFNIADDRDAQRKVLERVQNLEHQGYQFEAATASFELLVHDVLGRRPTYWKLDHYRCSIHKRDAEQPVTEATVKLSVGNTVQHEVAEGDGPVNALDAALRRALQPAYPQLRNVHLVDFKVRVVNPTAESAATVRVIAEWVVKGPDGSVVGQFGTIGVNENIVDASWQALVDAFTFHLIESKVQPPR